MVAALAAVGTFVTANAALLQGIGSAVSAFGAISSASAQQKQYNAQAAQAKIQGRTQAIQYKQQGADVLRNINETLAMTTARAGQFGDPTLGSALALQKFALKEGYGEYGTSIDNSQLALAGAAAQASIYRQAGRTAMVGGMFQAAGTLGEGIYRQTQLRPVLSA